MLRIHRSIPNRFGIRPVRGRWFSSSASSGGNWWDDDGGVSEKDSKSPKSIFEDVDESKLPSKKVDEENITKRRSSLFTAAPQRRVPVVEGTPQLTMSQALFLAKEAGVYTTKEVQTHIIKSPSFSTDKSPFLMEDFFSDQSSSETVDGSIMKKSSQISATLTNASPSEEKADETESNHRAMDTVPNSIHDLLSAAFQPGVEFFTARGREWKTVAEGKGTRKRSVAHVVITRGTGVVKVNGEEDFYKRWPLYYNRFDVLYPFEATKAAGLFDVYIAVKGGGISGQAGAARLAVGRALVDACAACEDDLKETLVLYEDTRQKTSKFPGKRGAYARGNWTLR
jgi:small subunit ribosomal protein S9